MDPELAEPATSRRAWLGAAGAAGLVGAAALLLSERPVGAAPSTPTASDTELLAAAQALELTAHDLYQLAIAAGVDDPTGVIGVMATNHRAYAEAIAGITGVSADSRNEAVYSSLESGFDTSDLEQFAAAGVELENAAVATHTELLGEYESAAAVNLAGSIIVVEARHATVLGDMLGEDPEALVGATGSPVSTTEASA